jgi:predicted acetyltransferase
MNPKKNLTLRSLLPSDEKVFFEAAKRWDNSPGVTWNVPNLGQSFSNFVQMLANHEKSIDLPEGFVPSTTFYAFINDEIVARLSLRHTLNDFLNNFGGHIGYGVLPEWRRQGIATKILEMTLPHCKNLGLAKVLITCDEDNIGSAKTIEKNGGVFENHFDPGDGRPLKRRYWIKL